MAHAHWVTGGELGKGRREPQRTVHCPQSGQQHNAGDGPGLKIRGQEVVPGPQSSQQEKQRPGQPRAGAGISAIEEKPCPMYLERRPHCN